MNTVALKNQNTEHSCRSCNLKKIDYCIIERGKPNTLALRDDHSGKINTNNIPNSEEAARIYTTQTGNSLTEPHNFGTDPLEGYPLLQQRREISFYALFQSDKDIFEKVMKKQSSTLQHAINHFQTLSTNLSML